MKLENTALAQNLLNGKLPEVTVTIERKSIAEMATAIVLIGVIFILLIKLLKNI